MPTFIKTLDSSYRLELEVSQASQNIASNTSSVPYEFRLVRYGSSLRYSNYNNTWSSTIDGSSASNYGTYDFRSSTVKVLRSGTKTVGHNADGTKTISVTGSWNDAINLIPDGSVSGSFTLTTIPRASTTTISESQVFAGQPMTLTTSRASSAFTHEYSIIFNGQQVYFGSGSTTGTTYTPPLSLLQEMPDSVADGATLRTNTYNGSTFVGSSDRAFTLRAHSTAIPSITGVTATEAVSGLNANVGAFVQGISRLTVSSTGVAGYQGSTIAASGYKYEVAGQTISASTGTTGIISASGTVPLTATITDSRGRTNSATTNLTVLAYAPPKFNSLAAFRSTSGGAAQEDGTSIRVNVNAAVQSLIPPAGTQRNAIKITIYTRVVGATSWGTARQTVTPGGVTYNSGVTLASHPVTTAYEVRVDVTDDFRTATQVLTVPTAAVLLDFNGTSGVGVGGYHTRGLFEVHGTTYVNGDLFSSNLNLSHANTIDTQDLNTVVLSGEYINLLNANATVERNYPTARAGWLTVAERTTGMVFQRYQTHAAPMQVFVRALYNGTWTGWREAGFKEDIIPHMEAVGSASVAIPNNVWTPINFTTAANQTLNYSGVGLSTTTVTIQRAGVYSLTGAVKFAGATGGNSRGLGFYVSAYGTSQVGESNPRSNGYINFTIPVSTAWIGRLAANSTVQMVAVQNSGGTVNVTATEFGLSYLGAYA